MPDITGFFKVTARQIVTPADPVEIAVMQGEVGKQLTGLCTIQKISRLSDGNGGQTKTYTTIATKVPCLIDGNPTKQGDSSLGANAPSGVYPAYFAYSAVIDEECRILHGANTYEVWAILNDLDPAVFIHAELIKVNAPT